MQEKKDSELLQPFGSGETSTTASSPWIATTPTRALAPLLPPQPAEVNESNASTEEKPDVMVKLEGLKKMLADKGVVDENVLAHLAEIEKASKDGVQQPALTHKTLNQLQKSDKQLQMLKSQMKEMDSKWAQWSDYMKAKFAEQGGLYKEKRKILYDRYQELKEKQKHLRLEVQRAALTAPEVADDDLQFVPPEVSLLEVSDLMTITDSEDEKEKETNSKAKKGREREGATAASPSKVMKLG